MMKSEYPLVSIVILNWNGIDDTLECLKSVKKLNYPNFETIVIDNNSEDNSLEHLRKISWINLIESPSNTGFAGGHIAGYEHSKGEYIALLNNDLVVDPGWLTNIVNCARNHDADIVGGRSFNWNDDEPSFEDSNSYNSYQVVNPVTAHTTMLKQGNHQTEANNLSGSNLLVSKKAIKHIGYFDKDFFAYYEETDFIARAKRAGLKAVYCPEAKTWHKSGASTKTIPFFYYYQMHRNRFWFAFKNFNRSELRRFIAFYHKEVVGAYRGYRKNKNLHDKALVKSYFANLINLPSLVAKRIQVQKLGSDYSQKITAAEEGFDDITVVIPCYNYANFIEETLESLEKQKLRPYTVIVINDGSTDSSAKVIRSYINQHKKSKIKYKLIDKENEGVIKTKNMALNLVETNWLVFLDADDTLHPDYLYKCVKQARQDNSDIVYTDMQMFGATDDLHRVKKFNHNLLKSVNLVHNSALMKTEIFRKSGGYKEKMSLGFEDWELYLTISKITKRFSYIPEPLFNYRRHEGSSRDVSAQNKLPIIVKYLEELHPDLYSMKFYWWLEIYRSKQFIKELMKVPLNIAAHTKSHVVKRAKQKPDSLYGKTILSAKKVIKRGSK